MNILHRIFTANKYKFCVSCNRRLDESQFEISDNSAGICCECNRKIRRTKWGSSFEAHAPIKYILSPFEYYGSIITILRGLKFRSSFKNGDILCIELKSFLKSYPHLADFDYVIPIPLSKQRMNERGFNQSEIFARCISKTFDIPLNITGVSRTKHTVRQSALNTADRIKNVQNAFSAEHSLKDKRIILVDDIYTTGNTMASCAKAIADEGAREIIGIAAAVTVKKTHQYRLYPPVKPLLKCRSIKQVINHFKYK